MWRRVPTTAAVTSCEPPFSFFFDLIEVVWRCDSAHPAVVAPLHRLCTLARKQGARTCIIESALSRAAVVAEIDDLDAAYRASSSAVGGVSGAAEAVAVSFFSTNFNEQEFNSVSDASFIGQAVIINYTPPAAATCERSYVFEAIFRKPAIAGQYAPDQQLLNSYVCVEREFTCFMLGRPIQVFGVYYAQQNAVTHACAQACLRMILNTVGDGGKRIQSCDINKMLGVTTPGDGLTIQQIDVAIKQSANLETNVYDCSQMDAIAFTTILAAVIESGRMALLVFTTGQSSEHVVSVYGHTRNSDEWHPQAIPAYSGAPAAAYIPSAAWIDHFLIHDDNFGPYYALGSRALDGNQAHPTVKPHWIVAAGEKSAGMAPNIAESLAAIFLKQVLGALKVIKLGRWFNYLTETNRPLVLRTVLMTATSYIDHLKTLTDHDGMKLSEGDVAFAVALPSHFWMVEFSLPELYTGNRSKLGEVLLSCDQPTPANFSESLVGIRLPELMLLYSNGGQTVSHKPVAMRSHSSAFRVKPNGHEW